ncbi:MAG TPA: BrnT family toxin [Woeseiaceae bacterium]|nr:BrnT family toxin [Woeseiaceae bacterium]
MLTFEWNRTKARANALRHGVTFDEARSVFYDEQARQFFDEEHSESEDRFVMLGLSDRFRILVVCHAASPKDEAIRIISARKATRRERTSYLSYMR